MDKDKTSKNTQAYDAIGDAEDRARFYHLVFEYSADAIFVLDSNGTIKFLNPTAEHLFDRPAEQLVGEKFAFLVNTAQRQEVDIVRPGKESRIAEIHAVETELHGEKLYVISLRDITEFVRLREELRALAFIDELTSLGNRRAFFLLAQQQLKLADRAKKSTFLLLVDLDDIAFIKNTHGHQQGERALIEASNIIKNTFRKSDIISRTGDDQFAILALEPNENSANIMAARLEKNLESFNNKGTLPFKLFMRMGISRYDPSNPSTIDELINLAEMVLKSNKRGEQKSALLWYISQKPPSQSD
jgi:two-component system cell cycle response regulator